MSYIAHTTEPWHTYGCCSTSCGAPQHIATHCSTLQHAATHCNMLQLTAAHCDALQHTAKHCNILQRTAIYCNALQYTATHRNTPQHTTAAAHCNTLQRTATHCNTLQHTPTYMNESCHATAQVVAHAIRDRNWGKNAGWGFLFLAMYVASDIHQNAFVICFSFFHFLFFLFPFVNWDHIDVLIPGDGRGIRHPSECICDTFFLFPLPFFLFSFFSFPFSFCELGQHRRCDTFFLFPLPFFLFSLVNWDNIDVLIPGDGRGIRYSECIFFLMRDNFGVFTIFDGRGIRRP